MPKSDLYFTQPIMNAAGILGFAPDPRGPVDFTQLGAFVTNPISHGPRTPAHGQRYQPYPGGFLLHTGLPNPGLSQVLRRYRQQWARSPVPIIVHLMAFEPTSLAQMIERLEGIEGVMGVELGLPPEIDEATADDFVRAAAGELPLIVRLPLEQAEPLAAAALEAGASAVSLGAPRGKLGGMNGRMYGPGVLPLALRAVENLAVRGIPVIGAGGLYRPRDVVDMLAAGASAVQVDALLWRDQKFPRLFENPK
jgi:dihydroorotate dehydrogenase